MRSLMLGENEVSFSTAPISWAVASSALRSTSSVIGSKARAGRRHREHSTSSTPLACDAGAIARIEHRGRGHLLDHGRALDLVAGEQRLARQHLRLGPAAAPRRDRGPRRTRRRRREPAPRSAACARPARSVGSSGVSTLPMAVAPKPTISIGASGSAWPKRCAVGGVEIAGEARPRARRLDARRRSAARSSGRRSGPRRAPRPGACPRARRSASSRRWPASISRRAIASARSAVAGRVAEDVRLDQVVAQVGEQLAQRAQDARRRRHVHPRHVAARAPPACRASAPRRRTAPACTRADRGRARPRRRGCRARCWRAPRAGCRPRPPPRRCPSGRATWVSIAACAAAADRAAACRRAAFRPPSRPSTRLASEIVGRVPPRP